MEGRSGEEIIIIIVVLNYMQYFCTNIAFSSLSLFFLSPSFLLSSLHHFLLPSLHLFLHSTLPSSLPPLSLLSFVSILPLLFLSLPLLPSLPIGPSRPLSPVNTTATSIRYNGAVINWIVTSIAYTPEQYTVLYGTSSNNLSQSSLVLNGSANFSITDAVLSLDLIDLTPDTMYYYRVRSNNTVGSTESDINNFRTKENCKCIN